ncbi:Sugar phosphate isomerase/epimerase [Maribacter sedimenticola]|uniref:Sugar phosphate isomerase/epimerase n=1 Tax=Maribacter sedimenticola TaxID=228956 RepID=A0ABY1SDU0_9FLAO|nr:TIM barrel protein [Maribacter sedimenticola]SNR27308.1 Sugar phosphate isomerase/epimerase [Maribacter sedimenticola]
MAENKNLISRRHFTKISSMAIGGIPLINFGNPLKNENPEKDLSIHLFSKHLQFLNYNDMAAAAKELGFNGLDLTVRPKGHVVPEKVSIDLPKAVQTMKKYGLTPSLMTTNIWDSTNINNIQILETASKLGFTHYRTDWLTYPEERTISQSQIIYGQQAAQLEVLNKRINLIGCYKNYAGNHVGAPIWDLPPILEATDNTYMGCQYDIRHAMVEGGSSWELGLRRISPFIKSIVIKDFKWARVNGIWKPVNTPLGEGMVDFKRYFTLLKKYKINVPVSLHLEYDLGGAEHGATHLTIDKKVVFAQMGKDLQFIKDTWDRT